MKYLRAIEEFINKHLSTNVWEYLLDDDDDDDDKPESNKIKKNQT